MHTNVRSFGDGNTGEDDGVFRCTTLRIIIRKRFLGMNYQWFVLLIILLKPWIQWFILILNSDYNPWWTRSIVVSFVMNKVDQNESEQGVWRNITRNSKRSKDFPRGISRVIKFGSVLYFTSWTRYSTTHDPYNI